MKIYLEISVNVVAVPIEWVIFHAQIITWKVARLQMKLLSDYFGNAISV